MNLKKIAVGLSFVLFFSTSLAFADPVQEKQAVEQKLNQAKKDYNDVMKEIGQIESKIEEIDNAAYLISQEVKKNEDEIDNINKLIQQKQEEINKAEKEFEERKKLSDERIKNMYMNGSENYLELILGFESFSDLISRIETVKTIIQFDINALDEINKGIEELNAKKAELENQKLKVVELKKQNEIKLEEINAKKLEQKQLMASLENKKKQYSDQIKQYQAKIYALYNQIQSQSQKSPSRGNVDYSSNDVVGYAMKYLGTPYVWGGSTPSGFDCSGYVKYVYAHFGVNLPRVAADQARVGQAVSLSEAQPGDLVFFHSPISHVGIYVGNGMYIHAPQTGDVVKVSSLSGRNVTAVRRIK